MNMKKQLLIAAILISTCSLFGQSKMNYSISAEAHALMCPFLSPQLMKQLTLKGAENIYKDDQSILHFTTAIDKQILDDTILKLVDNVGYEAKYFKIERTTIE